MMDITLLIVLAVIVLCVLLAKSRSKKKKNPQKEVPDKDRPEKENLPVQEKNDAPAAETKPVREYPVYWYSGGQKLKGVAKVTQGLQIFDETGKLTLDITSHLTKYLGNLHIPNTAPSGSYADSRLKDGEFWFLITGLDDGGCHDGDNDHKQKPYTTPSIWAENGAIKWQYKDNSLAFTTGVTIIYGIL